MAAWPVNTLYETLSNASYENSYVTLYAIIPYVKLCIIPSQFFRTPLVAMATQPA
jgi:hypothetical protein